MEKEGFNSVNLEVDDNCPSLDRTGRDLLLTSALSFTMSTPYLIGFIVKQHTQSILKYAHASNYLKSRSSYCHGMDVDS